MDSSAILESLAKLDPVHRTALEWFRENKGHQVPWPQPLQSGMYLVNKAKGIHKPKELKYALSVRQSLKGPYPDREPVVLSDGSWTYDYYQEGTGDPREQFTNRALIACERDGVPVGVIRQVKAKPNPRYLVMGLAIVEKLDKGFFSLRGFSDQGANSVRMTARDEPTPVEFDPTDVKDARKWIQTSIVRRQGQGRFRAEVVAAYGSRCAVTGFDCDQALEAAHIFPYMGTHTNVVRNGILLRADVHTLYDLGLICIDPEQLRICVAPSLQSTEYKNLEGKAVGLPSDVSKAPSRIALRKHYDWATAAW